MKKVFSIIVLLSLILAPFNADAQRVKRTKTKKQKQEQIDKSGENRAKLESELSEKQEHHIAIQDKSTRKRMKANQKRQRRMSKGKAEPFYRRWFRKK